MSEGETLTFGPEWLRALSSGNSVTSPPPSPGPKYKLAEFRYGKEEMLALFTENLLRPKELDSFEGIGRNRPALPLAFIPHTEEEQRNIMGSVNSNAVLKLMGRGGTRGAVRGTGRGGRGSYGRGRGDGSFMRQTSYEENRLDASGGFGKSAESRRPPWSESGRGFERGPPREPGRGYDPSSASRPRLSSDSSWERNERGFDSSNWRSSGHEEDEDGWRISGHRTADRGDRWRGSTRGRGSWRASEPSRERSHAPDDEWQTMRRSKSYHERDDGRWKSPVDRTDHLPEWSSSDTDDFSMTGSFDSSGAFVSQKKRNQAANQNERPTDEHQETTEAENNNKWTKDPDNSESNAQKPTPTEEDTVEDKGRPLEEKTAISAPAVSSPSVPPEESSALSSSTSTHSSSTPSSAPSDSTQEQAPASVSAPIQDPQTAKPQTPPQISPQTTSAPSSPQGTEMHLPQPNPPASEVPSKKSERSDDEPNMEHFAQAAENLVASLDEELENDKVDENVGDSTEEIQWLYTDPQGKVQGPFSNSEMADWFEHGYFTMTLLVKREVDDIFHPLGDLIKQWGRVPFLPGPQPPPLRANKAVPDHVKQQQQQQQLLAQQQYQRLIHQHYLQQQYLHQQQALMLQRQQMMQMQQQQQQMQSSPPASSVAPQPHQSSESAVPGGLQQLPQSRPHSLPTHSESIWGAANPPQTSPAMISPGPWSPVSTIARGWDANASGHSGVQPAVPSFEEIQRREEEEERQRKLAAERREAEARAAQQRQEEEERRRQHEAMLQKQREEEERRRQLEELERKQKEEELLKKQQEEARRMQEDEMRRKQHQEALRKQQLEQQLQQQEKLRQQQQEALRKQQLEQQLQQQQQQQQEKLRQQQQQAVLRLQHQQQLKQEMQQRKDMELQQKLQQKRQQSQVQGNTLWGAPAVTSTPSLAQIQHQEERRNAYDQRMRLLQAQHEQQQQQQQHARALPGWGDRPANTGNSAVRSFLEIQEEEARQLAKRQQQQRAQQQQLSKSQPSPLTSSVWSNHGSLSSSWAPNTNNGNIWGMQAKSHFIDDDGDDDEDGESFWDDAVKYAKGSGKTQQPSRVAAQNSQSFPTLSNANTNVKAANRRTTREEEAVRRLFQQQLQQAGNVDEFSQWCDITLRSMKTPGIDIPTFIAFLRDVQSPYEVHDYVKQYLGDSSETREFAREFIERRNNQKSRLSPVTFPQANVWGGVTSQNVLDPRPGSVAYPYSAHAQQEQAGLEEANQSGQDGNKRRRKKRMQKVDPSILGFSVNAADRVNMGEIQTLEDH